MATILASLSKWFFHNDAFSFPFAFNTTWTKNRHTVRFGLDVTPEGKSELANPSSNNTNGTYIFTGDATGVYDADGNELSAGNAIADMLLGKAYNYSETALDLFGKYRWINIEPYVEDQFKVRPNITLTAGVRYEWYQTEYEQHNMLSTFTPSRFNPANASVVDQWGEITTQGDPLNGIMLAGKTSPYGRSVFPGHNNAFAPRIGIAWDPTNSGKMSVRAGYGIYYDRWGSYSQFGANNPPYNQIVSIYNTSLTNPGGAAGINYPPALSAVLSPWKFPSTQKWSLSVQREVLPDTTASIAYVGTKGTHLLGNYNLNQPDPNPLIQNWTISPDYVRPYQGYSGITAFTTEFGSNYNALQATLIHRLRKGLSFQASYTYSKALTDSSGTGSFPQNSYDWRAEYGPADFDQRQIFTANYSYDLPFFRGTKGFKNALLAGWQVSGITTYQSGGPITVTLLGDWAGVGSWNERATIVGDPNKAGPVAANPTCDAPSQIHVRANWFNPCAFVTPTPGTFGNSSRGILTGPGVENWDLGLMKQFAVRESMNLQFRAEAFNTFNTPGRGGVDTTADDANFSKMSGGNSPRILQLSLAFTF